MTVISTTAKIEKACGDKHRPTLEQPYLRVIERKTGRGRNRRTHHDVELQATDSYCFARIRQVEEADPAFVEGPVPVEVLKFTRERKGVLHVEGDRFVVRRDNGSEIASFPRPPADPKFPKLSEKAPGLVWPNGDPKFTVGINPHILIRLAEALGAEEDKGVRLDLFDPLKPMLVTPLGAHVVGTQGLIMPIRIAAP